MNRLRELSLLVIVVISWVLFYNCFYEPLREETSRIKANNTRLEKQMQEAQNRSRSRQATNEQLNRLVALHKENVLQVPDKPGKGELLVYLAETARANGIRLAAVQETEGRARVEGPFPSYRLCLRLKGRYENLWTFLRELETGTRLISIKKIRLYAEREANPTKTGFALMRDGSGAVRSSQDAGPGEAGTMGLEAGNFNILVCECDLVVYFDPSSPKLE